MRSHPPVVAASTLRGVNVIGLHEAVCRVYEILIDGWEVEHGDAALREKNEPLIGEIQQGIGQQPLLSINKGDRSPGHFLAGDLAGEEGGVLGDVELVVGEGVDVDGVEAVVAAEEAVPERREGERAAGHEEEGDLGDALEGEVVGDGDEGGAPEELRVGHGVREVRRVDERLEGRGAVGALARAEGVRREEELGVRVVVVAGHVGARGEPDDHARHEDDGHGDQLHEEPRRPPLLPRRRRAVVRLLVPGGATRSPRRPPSPRLQHRLPVPPHHRR